MNRCTLAPLKAWAILPAFLITALCGATLIAASAADRDALYTVQAGDTLAGIAQRQGTTISQLKEMNNLEGNTLRAGQVLEVPSEAAASPYPYAQSPGEQEETVRVRATKSTAVTTHERVPEAPPRGGGWFTGTATTVSRKAGTITVDETMIREMLREDIETMAGVIERTLQERLRGHFQPSNLFQKGVQGLYVKNMGAFFICEVDFDVATPPEEPTLVTGKEKSDLWDEVKSSLKRGEQAGRMGMGMGDYGMMGTPPIPPGEAPPGYGMWDYRGEGGGGSPAAPGYPGEVEKDRRILLRDLDEAVSEAIHLYGPRIRGLGQSESIVVAVFGREARAPVPVGYYWGLKPGQQEQLQKAEHALEQARLGLEDQEAKYKAAQHELVAAEDNLKAAEGKVRRSQEKLNIIETRVEAGTSDALERLEARAEVEEAVEALQSLKHQLERKHGELDRTRAELARKKEAVERAEDHVARAGRTGADQEKLLQQLEAQLLNLKAEEQKLLDEQVSLNARANLAEKKTKLVEDLTHTLVRTQQELNKKRDEIEKIFEDLEAQQMGGEEAVYGMMGMGGYGMGEPGMGMMGMMGMPGSESGQQTVRTYRVDVPFLEPDGSQEKRTAVTEIFAY